MGRPSPDRLRLSIALATVYVVWGSTYLAIRYAIESLPPLSMTGVRVLLAGGVLYGLARLRGAPRPEGRHWAAGLAVGSLLLVGGSGGVVLAQRTVESGTAALLVSTIPVWIVILASLGVGSWRPGGRAWAGVALGLGGVALVVRPGPGGGAVDPVGAAVLLLASLSWATGSLFARRLPAPDSTLLASGLHMICAGPVLLAIGALSGELTAFEPARTTLRSALAVAYLFAIGSVVAYAAYGWLLRHASPGLVGSYAYVNPVVAVFLGWLVAGEAVGGGVVFGSCLIVVGVAAISLDRARRP